MCLRAKRILPSNKCLKKKTLVMIVARAQIQMTSTMRSRTMLSNWLCSNNKCTLLTSNKRFLKHSHLPHSSEACSNNNRCRPKEVVLHYLELSPRLTHLSLRLKPLSAPSSNSYLELSPKDLFSLSSQLSKKLRKSLQLADFLGNYLAKRLLLSNNSNLMRLHFLLLRCMVASKGRLLTRLTASSLKKRRQSISKRQTLMCF